MRISTQQIFNRSVEQMQSQQTQLAKTQEQISTGKKILQPSDDPIAAAQILKLNREIARFDKFEDNIDVASRRLELEETVLDQVDIAADRMKELTIQAGSATLTDADRSFIAEEVRQLQDHIAGLMNTQDAQGEYLFAGSKAKTPPFVEQGDGSFIYQGDDGQRFIQVGAEVQVASNDSGRAIFEVIPDDIEVDVLGADTSLVSNVSVLDPEADTYKTFSDTFGDVRVVISKEGDTAGAYRYSVLDSAGSPITGTNPAVLLDDISFDSSDLVADTVEFGGIQLDLSDLSGITDTALSIDKTAGSPDTSITSDENITNAATMKAFFEANGDVRLNFSKPANTFTVTRISDGADVTPGGVPIDFSSGTISFAGYELTDVSIADGDTLDLRASADVTLRAEEDRHSLLQTAEDLINLLETPVTDTASRIALSEGLATALEELSLAKEGNLKVRTAVGARINTLDDLTAVNADFKLFTETTLSLLEDVDLTEAISEFQLQEITLQAAQATFARVQNLNLFNFL
ncbi:MAG: flagellar hook-associated protein FlgL [Motiliproteus sp.]|nr:flagellar hook-associated protein FlgL [Motiliproteus sp.]MCW9051992.1 flagellar hook-associated protein FlgL [Motiliproteus sp.]